MVMVCYHKRGNVWRLNKPRWGTQVKVITTVWTGAAVRPGQSWVWRLFSQHSAEELEHMERNWLWLLRLLHLEKRGHESAISSVSGVTYTVCWAKARTPGKRRGEVDTGADVFASCVWSSCCSLEHQTTVLFRESTCSDACREDASL